MEDDATRWLVPVRSAWIAFAVPLILTVGVQALLPLRSLYLGLTAEDSVIEWLQFATVVAIAVTYALLAVRTRRRYRWFALLAAILAIGAVFVAGEEISWGQRILGWETLEELAEVNRQGESNIHNIVPIQRAFGVAELLAAAYGFAVPVVVVVLAARRQLPDWRYLVVPPLFLGTAFAVALAYRTARLTVLANAGQTVNRFGELAELLLYAAILAFAVLAARRQRVEPTDASGPGPAS